MCLVYSGIDRSLYIPESGYRSSQCLDSRIPTPQIQKPCGHESRKAKFSSSILNGLDFHLAGVGAHNSSVTGHSRHPIPLRDSYGFRTNLECFGSCFRHGVVLLSRTSANTNGAHHFSFLHQWNSTGENHDFAVVGGVNSKKLATRLAVHCKIFGGNVEGTRCERLLLGNVDTADPCVIHSNMRD